MKDLVTVFKLLNICADRIEEHPVYIEPMVNIVRLCGVPFLKEKSSDEIAFEQIAIESVAQLGNHLYSNVSALLCADAKCTSSIPPSEFRIPDAGPMCRSESSDLQYSYHILLCQKCWTHGSR